MNHLGKAGRSIAIFNKKQSNSLGFKLNHIPNLDLSSFLAVSKGKLHTIRATTLLKYLLHTEI